MSGTVELHCCLSVVMCRDMWWHTFISYVLLITFPLLFTVHFKVTEPDTCHRHWVTVAVADNVK